VGRQVGDMTEKQPLVLVIEDEADMRTFARIALAAHGYRMIEASTAAEGIEQATHHHPDLVLLDLGLPDADGSEVTRRLREWSTVPILVISARGNEDAKVKALDDGADDYMTKPFGAAEMMARVRVAIRHAARSAAEPPAVVLIGDDIRVDIARRNVTVRGEEVHLTPIEFKLLATLVRHAGMVLTHRHLLEEVWGPGHGTEMQYLRVYMTQLRHKLERKPARPKYLMTEPGIGYRLRLET
jgi:two-component system KDP operon response regulator KdpE